jgi:putative oxidoreductase
MNTHTQDTVALVARVLLALMFIISGFGKITGFDGTVAYIASKGLPMPQVVAALTVALELGGGLMLAAGFKARWAALALAIFTVLAAVIFHNFWAVEAAQKMGQQINFMKNITIAGGMLMVFAFGPGRLSVDKS